VDLELDSKGSSGNEFQNKWNEYKKKHRQGLNDERDVNPKNIDISKQQKTTNAPEKSTPQMVGEVQLDIMSAVSKKKLGKMWTEYVIQVQIRNDEPYIIERSFNEFEKLHSKLKKKLKDIKLPTLPPTQFFGLMEEKILLLKDGNCCINIVLN